MTDCTLSRKEGRKKERKKNTHFILRLQKCKIAFEKKKFALISNNPPSHSLKSSSENILLIRAAW